MPDLVVGPIVGGMLGLVMMRGPASPVVRSAIAAGMAYVGSVFSTSMLVASRIVDSGIVAVSFSLTDAALSLAVAIGLGIGVHWVVGRFAPDAVARYRPLLIGIIVGAAGAFFS